MNALQDTISFLKKQEDRLRYAFLTVWFFLILYAGIGFMNSGSSYEQAVSFRVFCIGFALICLTIMDWRQWTTIWSLLYVPICYFATHVAYEKHWIEDTCEYQFVNIIRLGKGVILLWGIVIIAVLREMITNRKNKEYWNLTKRIHPVLGGLWFLFIIWLTLFKRDYFYATFFVICYTILFWINREKEKRQIVWKALMDAVVLSFFYVVFMMLMHRPYDCERYTAYFVNANMAGMYLACVIAVLFVKVDQTWKKIAEKGKIIRTILLLIVQYMILGYACCIAIFNYTRTTIMGMGFGFFTLFLLQLWKEKKKWKVLLEYLLVLVSIVSLFQATYLTIRYIPAYVNDPIYFAGEYDPEVRIMKDDPIDSPKYTTIGSFLTLALGKWGIYVNLDESGKSDGSETVIDTERDVTNGRVEIWQAYLGLKNWTGHYPGHITLDSGYFVYHAHSTYFHILYQYGIPAGIIYALMMLSAYVAAVIRYLKDSEHKSYLVLAVLITGTTLVGQITEWMGHPAYVICMMMFMMYGLLMGEKSEKGNGLVKTDER